MLSGRKFDQERLTSADRELIEQISQGVDSVPDLCSATGVTATAVRQRLTRLEAGGLLEKQVQRAGRGRPRNAYRVTELGYRKLGSKADELALALWSAVAATEESDVRERLMGRLRDSMRSRYGREVTGASVSERMHQLGAALHDQGFPVEVVSDAAGGLPVLRETHCPYREIAAQDASICELERAVYSDVLGTPVELTACCREGEPCCQFEVVHGSGS
jgi:predicted ArsR family transcriptional regulator